MKSYQPARAQRGQYGIAIVKWLSIVLVFTSCGMVLHKPREEPRVINGVIDLRNWDFEKDGTLNLNGDWDFYWKRFVKPAVTDGMNMETNPTTKPELSMAVPGIWNKSRLGNQALGAFGFATYSVKVLLPAQVPDLALRLDVRSAVTVFWNEKRVVHAGVLGSDTSAEEPVVAIRYAALENNLPIATLLIHTSNFHHPGGGLATPISLGTRDAVYGIRDRDRAIEMFIAGALLLMGAYHLGIFYARRKDRSALWFGILSLIVVVRVVAAGERQILEIVPSLSFEIVRKLGFLSFYTIVPVFFWFLHSLVPDELGLRSRFVVTAISIPLIASVTLLPFSYYSYTLTPFQVFALIAGLYVTISLTRAAWHKRPFATLILVGWLVFFVAAINDIVYSQFRLGFRGLVPAGLFFFALTNAAILSRRIALAFNQSEDLSANLQIAYADAVELRQKLVEKEKMATVGDMAAGIVHDLKNPVSIIKGSVEMADQGETSREERSTLLQIIDQEADRMLSLVQDLLDFSRGSVAIRKRSTNLGHYLNRIKQTIEPAFNSKGISLLVSQAHSDLLGDISIDPDRFLRVLVNIAGNAADVLKSDDVFEVAASRNNGRVTFTLRDNGPGIPEPIRETLFQPFVTYGKSHGTGLGMAIAKSVVEAHDGTISFQTEAGRGTTFTIEMPA